MRQVVYCTVSADFLHSGIYQYSQHPRSLGSFVLFLSTQQKVPPWRACLIASLFTTNLAFLHPSELCCTLELHCIMLSFTLLHPTELPCTLLSFTASFLELHCTCELHCTLWVTLHPTELCYILLSYAAPYWAIPHLTKPHCTLLSYFALWWAIPSLNVVPCWATPLPPTPYWAMLQPSELRCIFWSMLHLPEPLGTPLNYLAPY